MIFTRNHARISHAYRMKWQIPLNPEWGFFGPLTDEMEQVLARQFALAEGVTERYQAWCHAAIELEREFCETASEEAFAAMYENLWSDDRAIQAHTLKASPIMVQDLIDQQVAGLMERSGYESHSYRSINQ